MPEKMPGPEFRIVGGASEEEKEKAERNLLGYFGERHLEGLTEEERRELQEREIPKTESQRAVFVFANEKSNELMKRVGVDFYDVPDRNLHIVPFDIYKKVQRKESAVATTVQNRQEILVVQEEIGENETLFTDIAFHELMHLKSHYAVQVEEFPGEKGKKEVKKTTYRSGLTMTSTQQKAEVDGWPHEHFRGLNEAIVAMHEREFMRDALRTMPELREEYLWMGSIEGRVKCLQTAQKIGFDPDDVFWVDKDSDRYNVVSYPRQRKTFMYVLEEIQKELPDQYPNAEALLDKFTEAFFTGRILELSRITEQAFGEGGFRMLGMMNDDRETPIEVMEALRKMRSRVLSKRREEEKQKE